MNLSEMPSISIKCEQCRQDTISVQVRQWGEISLRGRRAEVNSSGGFMELDFNQNNPVVRLICAKCNQY
jgi:hypothetical protein